MRRRRGGIPDRPACSPPRSRVSRPPSIRAPPLTHESGLGRWLHRIDVPTLLLWGEADRTVPFAQAAVWAAALPKASIKSFAGAGHLLFEERPETTSALVDFLRD